MILHDLSSFVRCETGGRCTVSSGKCAGLTILVLALVCFCCGASAFGQAKPIELTYSTHMPAPHAVTLMSVGWGKEVEKRTNGRVKVTVFAGGTMLAADKAYDGVTKGIADIGVAVLGFTRGRFPLTEAIDLPLGYRNAFDSTRLLNAYLKRFKPKEFDEVNILYAHAHGPGVLHSSKKAVATFDDLRGLKVRCTGLSAKIVGALGGAPVAMPVGDTYDALSRGVVDASLAPFEALEGWRWAEVVKYSTESPAFGYTSAFVVVMNKKKWDALPPDIRTIIQQVSDGWGEKDASNWFTIEKSGKDFGVKHGVKVIAFSKEDNEKAMKAVKPLLDEYVQNMKKAGLPGEEVIKFCTDELKKIQQ